MTPQWEVLSGPKAALACIRIAKVQWQLVVVAGDERSAYWQCEGRTLTTWSPRQWGRA